MLRGRRLLVITGLAVELPSIPGFRERWGRDLVHRPYYHGLEVRDRRIGVIRHGPLSVHQALGFRQYSEHITFFPQDTELTAEDRARLDVLDIRVIPGEVTAVEVRDDRIAGVRPAGEPALADAEVVVVAPRMVACWAPFAEIGVTAAEHPAGAFVEADRFGATAVPGVWAAGNV